MGTPVDLHNTTLELTAWDAETYFQNLYVDKDGTTWRGVANLDRASADANRDKIHATDTSRRIGLIRVCRGRDVK